MKPTFLVVGAAKCGTTTLYHFLKLHPAVYMSPIKEPNHFSTDILPDKFSPEYKAHEKAKNLDVHEYVNGPMRPSRKIWGAYVHDPEDYYKLFKYADGKSSIGEISNSYLYSNVAAKNIRSELPDTKIVMILRQPAERAYSHYIANLRDGRTTLSFRDEWNKDAAKSLKGWGISHVYYELGLYSEQVRRFKEQFPAEQIKIYLFDDLKNNTEGTIRDLFRFLGEDEQVKMDFTEKKNEGRMPKNKFLIAALTKMGIKKKLLHLFPEDKQETLKSMFFSNSKPPGMSVADYNYITGLYKTDIQTLQSLINRDLSHWLKEKH